MATEIERKFIARPQDWSQLASGEHLRQGYLSRAENATVRVRIQSQHATLTIKGKNAGIARSEFEYDIRRIWMDGTPEDRAVFTLAHPDVVEQDSRLTAYEEQVCSA